MSDEKKFIVMSKFVQTEYFVITARDKHVALQKFRNKEYVLDGSSEGWVGKETEDILVQDCDINLIVTRK